MKQFFEEYGGIALGVLALILLIVMVSPLKNVINLGMLKNKWLCHFFFLTI